MVPATAKSLLRVKGKTNQSPIKPGMAYNKPKKGAGLAKQMFVAIIATGLLIGSLTIRAQVINAGYQLHTLEHKLAATQIEYDRLNLSVAQLSSLAKIEREALISLGMTKPDKTEFITVASTNRSPGKSNDSGKETPSVFSNMMARISAQTEDIFIGLVSPFVARWFYDIPKSNHPRIRPK